MRSELTVLRRSSSISLIVFKKIGLVTGVNSKHIWRILMIFRSLVAQFCSVSLPSKAGLKASKVARRTFSGFMDSTMASQSFLAIQARPRIQVER